MNLYEKMQNDMIQAMKDKDKETLAVLRMVKGAIQLEHINSKKEINDELFIDVLSKQIKQRNESIEEFNKAKREDLSTKVSSEIQILKKYLPEQLTEEEIGKIMDEVFDKVSPTSPKDMGAIMKEITPLLKGKADMKQVSTMIKERLNNL